jgi:hypothetical protein
MFQQRVGINRMIRHSPTIFGYAGMTGLLAMMTAFAVHMLFAFSGSAQLFSVLWLGGALDRV